MRTICAILLCFLGGGAAFPYGTVWLSNKMFIAARIVSVPFYDGTGENPVYLDGPDYSAQLYAWQPGSGFVATDVATLLFKEGIMLPKGVRIPFVDTFGSVWILVRAWRSNRFRTFEEAALGGVWTGVSGILFVPRVGGPSGGVPVAPYYLVGLQYPGSPLVVRDPASQVVQVGETANLSVVASSGVKMQYQWYRDGGARPDGLIPGATNVVYEAKPATTTTYRVKITNQAGETVSAPATVTVVAHLPSLGFAWVAGKPVVTVRAAAGLTVQVERSADPVAGPWTSVGEVVTTGDPLTLVDNVVPLAGARFYRALVVR